MKEDFSKPLYADYRKQQAFRFFWNFSITSGEKNYELADMPLVVIGRILIVIAIGVIGWLNPFWCRHLVFIDVPMICLVFIIIVMSFYKYIFVYRFGRFRVTWEDDTLHSDEEAGSRCDKYGNFLKNEENRKAAKRSRRAFLVLFAGIIAAFLLYCFIWIGTSYTRVPSWHKEEIEEAWQIAQKYGRVDAYVQCRGAFINEGGVDMSKEDRRRIWEICNSLQWEYVYGISMSKDFGYIELDIDTIFGYSKLVWDEDITDASQVKHGYIADTAVQLDEHWFLVRMNDGRWF